MIRRPKTIQFWSGKLPHWEVENGRYFITIHLAGAIPDEGHARLRGMAEELRLIPQPTSSEWLACQRKIFREMETWLDRAKHNASLQIPAVAEMIIESIEHRSQRGDWEMIEYVVMPTHLHLFCELGSRGLKETIEDFKRWTGHQAAKFLGIEGERFWQREWFDHWSRSDEQDEKIVRYIRNNPVKAHLVDRYVDWPYGSWSRSHPADGM